MPDKKNKGTILPNVPDDDIINYTAEEEGFKGQHVDHLYLDHLGNVTVGFGRMIPNKRAMLDIPFTLRGRMNLLQEVKPRMPLIKSKENNLENLGGPLLSDLLRMKYTLSYMKMGLENC